MAAIRTCATGTCSYIAADAIGACARFAPSERPVPAPATGRPPELWTGGVGVWRGDGGGDQRAADRPTGALTRRRAHTRSSVCVRKCVFAGEKRVPRDETADQTGEK